MSVATALTGRQKAALVLINLGREAAAKVMAQLDETEIEELTTEIARMEHVDADVAAEVLSEFHEMSFGGRRAGRGGLAVAQEILAASIGAERAADLMARLQSSLQGQPFEFLQYADARQVVSLLNGEHPQTIALVLAHLRPDHASAIMVGLPPATQAEVAHRIALMERASPDVVQVVAETLQTKAATVLTIQEYSAVGGVQPLVDIINRADPGTEKLILEGLQERDEALAEEVRSRMFVFADITLLEERAIQLVLRGVEMGVLATALKGASEQVKEKVLRNLSERARENLVEEIDLLGPVRLSAVEEARASIVQVIRGLEESGQITIRREEADEYVA